MNLESLIEQLVNETTQRSLGHFSPEIALCVTMVGLLLVRLCNADRLMPGYWVALIGSLVAFGLAFYQFDQLKQAGGIFEEPFFTGLLVYDTFTVFLRLFLLLFLILVIALTVLSGIPDVEDGPDFYTLLLGSVVGMMLMSSANHLLILFLGVEMASVPSYVMVGFMKGRRVSSEAAFKFVVYGAGSAGVMLYGISLMAGLLGTADLSQIATRLNVLLGSEAGMADPTTRTVLLAILLVMVGLFFKLSLVPFHFWCPDAFEGAPAEVAGFLSVASKAAAFALLVRFVTAFAGPGTEALATINVYLGIGLGLIAAVTATFGNLAAYAQTNMKRLLAYSTIAHAGYMLMAVASLMVIQNGGLEAGFSPRETAFAATRSLEGLLYYLAVYLFMNLGAFAIVALIRNQIFSEEIDDYGGLIQQSPVLCVCMLFCMFSLIGLPPTGGFFAKWIIFWSLFQAGSVHWMMWVVLAVGAANTVFGLFYYLRVLKAMFLAPRPVGARGLDVPFMPVGVYVLMISLPILALGIFVDQLSRTANSVASVLIR